MSPHQLVALAVRLFAIWLFLYTIRQLIPLTYVFRTPDFELPQMMFVVFCVVLLGISVSMWVFPFTISNRIATFSPSSECAQSWTTNEVYGIGFVLLGFFLLFFGVSDAVYWIFYLIWIEDMVEGGPGLTLEQKGSITATVVELVFALVLILGSKGLAKMIHKMRYAGLD